MQREVDIGWRLDADVCRVGVKVDGDVAAFVVERFLPVEHGDIGAGLQHGDRACGGIKVLSLESNDADFSSVDDDVAKIALESCERLCGFREVHVAEGALHVAEETLHSWNNGGGASGAALKLAFTVKHP